MSRAVDRILGMSGKSADEPTEYHAFIESGSRPQMGFAITRANGDMVGFLYHNLDNMDFETRNGEEFVSFTHRARAVTVQGTGLRGIFRAIIRHTLMEMHEQDERPVAAGQPVITQVEVTTIGQEVPVARLVK